MKKRKTYEISVVDKTYSNTISDETKFYTSDTALELVFKLKETEYTFESAEIVLLNIDDRSLVTRPVAKVLDSFTYKLDDDIIAHYGEWRGQLRFEAGETYVSSPVKFRIENDLGNERPPQLSDVQSWVSLKRYADDLVDELKQAVLSVDGIEDTFNENENVRKTTFEMAESERDRTFESNETTRQSQELEREISESKRQTVFDENEDSRTEIFNTNEATRKANEEARELAENERENAEVQRKIDHANRSAELAGKADKVVLDNLSPKTVEDWILYNVTAILSNSEYAVTVVNQLDALRIESRSLTPILGHKYYVAHETKPSVDTEISTHFGNAMLHIQGYKDSYTKVTAVLEPVNSNPLRIYVRSSVAEIGDIHRIRNIMLFDLTDIFGASNEPTKEEMDKLLQITGYIDEEYALNNKEILIWTLALIRRNKNAIITLGGTI